MPKAFVINWNFPLNWKLDLLEQKLNLADFKI